MCLRRAPEKYIAGALAPASAALDRAGLDNRLTDVGEIVSLLHRPHSTPQKYYFTAACTHFY
jgi:hypothetical protein